MYPILIRVGKLTIYSYGFMLALAFIVGTVFVRYEAKRKNLNPDIAYDLALFAVLGGIIGARLTYVFGHWKDFSSDPLRIFALQQGGLVFYGGLVLGALFVLVYIKYKKLNPLIIADIVAPALALGEAIGRVGCFLNGCCYGVPTKASLGVIFPVVDNVSRHPTQIYHFVASLAVFGVLMFLRGKIGREGVLFWLYLLLYSSSRFTVEFFREAARPLLGMTASQITSLVIFLMAGAALFASYYYKAAPPQEK